MASLFCNLKKEKTLFWDFIKNRRWCRQKKFKDTAGRSCGVVNSFLFSFNVLYPSVFP